MSRYELFDRSSVTLQSVDQRGHQLHAQDCQVPCTEAATYEHPHFGQLIERIVNARESRRPIVVMMGAHPIKLGLSRYLIELMHDGWITHIATNGAGLIHDFELAACGGTSEDVAKWLPLGQFGLWHEPSRMNDIVVRAAASTEGIGEAIGRAIYEGGLPFQSLSIAATGWMLGIPVTSHVSIGSDILHSHPNFCGGAFGAASDTDFLIFAHSISNLDGGVYLNIGTAVTGPEVFLKALSMARNVGHRRRVNIKSFTVGVFDLVPLPENSTSIPPAPDTAGYYNRTWKTLLVRAVADGGRSFYFCADHRATIPRLWRDLVIGHP